MNRSWRLANRFAIPHTGRVNPYRQFRQPRNIGIKRHLESLRGEKVPPDSWMDIHRCVERNWKSQRRHQWRSAR